MRIKELKIIKHPAIGDLHLRFDDEDISIDTIVLAGGNGTGKTVLLETIHDTFRHGRDLPCQEVELHLELDDEDLRRLSGIDGTPKAVPAVATLKYDASQPNPHPHARSLIWADDQGRKSSFNFYVSANQLRGIFPSFLSEANVSFSVPATSSITALQLDDPDTASYRGGTELAAKITQLLVDIRAADAEDLANWVVQNPGSPPPSSVTNQRTARFTRAYDHMFPAKRFKGTRRVSNQLIIEFEENGKISTISQLSTGEKQIVFRAGFLLMNFSTLKSGIVLIDEPELSLHPEWQARIIGFYKEILSNEERVHPQLIVATHSPFIVHGATNAKVIILEKDSITGAIKEMSAPSYPAIRGYDAVRAFNVDSFLASAQHPLLILTEGESDAKIFAAAWDKLRPNKRRQFELRPTLGVKNMSIMLNDNQLFHKLGERMIVGVFDFDSAYDQWSGLWSNKSDGSTIVIADEPSCLVKKKINNLGWAMTLPVPSFRSTYASIRLGGSSILATEFLFRDCDIPTDALDYREVALGHRIPFVKDGSKANFASFVINLHPECFAAFEPLLSRWEDILEGRLR